MNIAYYVSAHGYGHAAREQAVINLLAAKGAKIFVRSAAPQKFFTAAHDYHPEKYDIGMVNPSTLNVDAAATFAVYADLMQRQDEIIRREVAFIRQKNIQVVVLDMPPVAAAIAEAAGIPSVAVTHFTWDRVYKHYIHEFPEYQFVLDKIRQDYGKTTLALQIQVPLPHEFDMFPVVEPIPGLANPATISHAEVRAAFNVPESHRIALLSMGGNAWGKADIRALRDLKNWTFLVVPSAYEQVKGLPQFRAVPLDYPGYHNLIAAADVLVGKAGGSTVAEVIAHRTPMIYTLNDNWFENELMEESLKRYCNSLLIPKDEFERGDWAGCLDEVVNRDYVWTDVLMNGADVAAEKILNIAR